MSDDTPCRPACPIDWMLSELTLEVRARMRDEAQADIQRERRGGNRRPVQREAAA